MLADLEGHGLVPVTAGDRLMRESQIHEYPVGVTLGHDIWEDREVREEPDEAWEVHKIRLLIRIEIIQRRDHRVQVTQQGNDLLSLQLGEHICNLTVLDAPMVPGHRG